VDCNAAIKGSRCGRNRPEGRPPTRRGRQRPNEASGSGPSSASAFCSAASHRIVQRFARSARSRQERHQSPEPGFAGRVPETGDAAGSAGCVAAAWRCRPWRSATAGAPFPRRKTGQTRATLVASSSALRKLRQKRRRLCPERADMPVEVGVGDGLMNETVAAQKPAIGQRGMRRVEHQELASFISGRRRGRRRPRRLSSRAGALRCPRSPIR
jgi:hypothetical protein